VIYRRRIVLEIRDDIAHRGEPSPDDHRILGTIDHLVDLPRGESLRHVDRAWIGDDESRIASGKLPFVAWHDGARTRWTVAHSENIDSIVGVCHWIRHGTGETMAEWDLAGWSVDGDVAANQARYRASRLADPRRLEVQRICSRRHIPLPAERDDGDAPFHEQGVAVELGRLR